MAPKKQKLITNRSDSHEGSVIRTSSRDSANTSSGHKQLTDNQQPAALPVAAPPPPPLPPDPLSLSFPKHIHKDVNVHFDSVPTVIYQPEKLNYDRWTPDATAGEQHAAPGFSDQILPHELHVLKHTIAVHKHPYRVEQLELTLAKVRGVHVADFAVSQEALNTRPSTESLTFEDPVPVVLPTIEKTGESFSVSIVQKPVELITDPVILAIERDGTADLIKAKYENDLYPPDDEHEIPEMINASLTSKPSAELPVGTVSGRPDMTVFYENYPLPDSLLDASSLLQISVAKRKKKLVLESPAVFFSASQPFSDVVGGATLDKPLGGATTGWTGTHDGSSSKHKKNASPSHPSPKPGMAPSSVVAASADGSGVGHGPLEPHHTSKTAGGKGENLKVNKQERQPSEMNINKSSVLVGGTVVVTKLPDLEEASRLYVLNRVVTPGGGTDPARSPTPSSDLVEKVVMKPKPRVKTESWDKFFGLDVVEEESPLDIAETGTGFDTVRGPTGLRKQFLDDEKNNGFFRELLDKLINKWLRQTVATPKASSAGGATMGLWNIARIDSLPSQPKPPAAKTLICPKKEKPASFHPVLADVLPIVRKIRDLNNENGVHLAAFTCAAEVYMEKLEQLQKVNFPRYDRGPQQMQLPIPGLAFDKMDRTTTLLQRHWYHSPAEPLMTTYNSQMYPYYDKKKEFITTEIPVLRFYAPLTSAKDLEYNPANFAGVSGTAANMHYMSTGTLEQCNSQYLETILKKQIRRQSRLRNKETRHLPVTPRPKTPGPHVTFSAHRRAPVKPKHKPDPFGKVSINVVRRLSGKYWSDRMLPKQRKGAKSLRYMEDTENWSIYVSTQANLVAAMKRKLLKDQRILRSYKPTEECYCKQPRINRHKRYIHLRKPQKRRVKIHWSRLLGNRSYTGLHCLRLQKPVGTAPCYQHPGHHALDLLTNQNVHKNPLWATLHDQMTEIEVKSAEKARKDAEVKPVDPDVDQVLVPGRPSEQYRAVSAASQLVSGGVKSASSLLSIAVPKKNANSTLRDLVGKHMKNLTHGGGVDGEVTGRGNVDGQGNRVPSANRLDAVGVSNATDQRVTLSTTDRRRLRNSPTVQTLLTPEMPEKMLSDWKADHDRLETFTFAQIPPDFQWDLLNCDATLDLLAEDAKEVSILDERDAVVGSPRLGRADMERSVLDLETSSLNVLKNSPLREETSGHSVELRQRLRHKEEGEARRRKKRVVCPPLLPAYMADKHQKREKHKESPKPIKTKSDKDSKGVVRTKPVSQLMYLLGRANAQVAGARLSLAPTTAVVPGENETSGMEQRSSAQQQHHRPSFAGAHLALTPPMHSQTNFVGQSLTGLGGDALVHPRLQRSLILLKKTTKRNPGSSSLGTIARKSAALYETTANAQGDNRRVHLDSSSSTDIVLPRYQRKSKFAGKGSMYVSTVKTQPRKILPKVQLYQQDKGNTAFFLDREKAAGIAITRQVESFSKLKLCQNQKDYSRVQYTRKKYGQTEAGPLPKDLFILNDNFWRRRPPFVVALNPVLGKNILPNLRHWLRKTHDNFSRRTNLPKNFKLTGEVGFTFRPRNEADAEREFGESERNMSNRGLDIVQRCLRKRVLDRLAHFIPETDNIRNLLCEHKLRLFEPEPIAAKKQRLLEEWQRNQRSFGDLELLYRKTGQRALLAFCNQAQSRLQTERLIRRYTGEYHYFHLTRALLKAKSNISAKEPKKPDAPLDMVVVVPDQSAETLDVERLGTARLKNSPTSGKNSKRLAVLSDGESEDGGVNNHREGRGKSAASIGKSALNRAKEKLKADQKEMSESLHKIVPNALSAKFPGGEKQPGEQTDQKSDLKQEQRKAAEDKLENEGPVWWAFNPANCFTNPGQSHIDSSVSHAEPSLFPSQMALVGRQQPNPVEILAEPPNLTFLEHSLLGLVALLKTKLSSDPKFAKLLGVPVVREENTGDQVMPDSEGGGMVVTSPLQERPRPGSILMESAPAHVKKTVKIFQDIANGTLFLADGETHGSHAEAHTAEHVDIAEIRHSLLQLNLLHDYDPHYHQESIGSYEPSRSRHTKRWMGTLSEVSEQIVRTSCHVGLGREHFMGQVMHHFQLRRKVVKRCEYYDASISYLQSLMPQTGSEVIMAKLQQLQQANADGGLLSRQSYKSRMGVLAQSIQDMTAVNCSTETEAFRNRVVGLILQLDLAKLYVKHHADQIARVAQRRYNQDSAAIWEKSIRGLTTWSNSCHLPAYQTIEHTPPQSPPRSQSPLNLKLDVVLKDPTDEDGNVRDKKGKGEKNAEKAKGLKKSKDGKTSDEKKQRIGSRNTGKTVAGKNSDNLKTSGTGENQPK